jgi:hypothetical protein
MASIMASPLSQVSGLSSLLRRHKCTLAAALASYPNYPCIAGPEHRFPGSPGRWVKHTSVFLLLWRGPTQSSAPCSLELNKACLYCCRSQAHQPAPMRPSTGAFPWRLVRVVPQHRIRYGSGWAAHSSPAPASPCTLLRRSS